MDGLRLRNHETSWKGIRCDRRYKLRQSHVLQASYIRRGGYVQTTSRVSEHHLAFTNLMSTFSSEKEEGMFGTLVICLPTLHEGGTLVGKHRGQTLTFETDKHSAFDYTFLAWYVQCQLTRIVLRLSHSCP